MTDSPYNPYESLHPALQEFLWAAQQEIARDKVSEFLLAAFYKWRSKAFCAFEDQRPGERIIHALTRDDLPAVVWEGDVNGWYRVVAFLDEKDDRPALFIEERTTDAMNVPAWRPVPPDGLLSRTTQTEVLARVVMALVGLGPPGSE